MGYGRYHQTIMNYDKKSTVAFVIEDKSSFEHSNQIDSLTESSDLSEIKLLDVFGTSLL